MKKIISAISISAALACSISFLAAREKYNTNFSEYSPTISADGNTMIYQTDYLKKNRFSIFMRYKTMDGWTKPVYLENVNSTADEGGPFMTYDQNALIISSTRKGGVGDVDLWVSQRHGTDWSTPVNMGPPVNSPGYDGFASLSPTRSGEGSPWSEPQKMPGPINSDYSEFGPIILADNITLIFSSTRPGGYGSYDLYKVEKQYDGSWTKPVNLGSFINTEHEDKLITIPAAGNILYYAKALPGKDVVYRIQSIPIPEKLQQSKVLTFSGTVMDEKNPAKRLHAAITITDLQKDDRPIQLYSNQSDGKFMVILNKGKTYDVSVKSQGYTFYSTRIDLTGLKYYKEMKQDILLEPLQVGAKIILNTLYFETGKYRILAESKYELQRVINLLDENPTMKLEISGHTDNVGSRKFNMNLSRKRAHSVMSYLTGQGIERERFVAKGYGPNRPIEDNDTEEGRMKNRRVEVRILAI